MKHFRLLALAVLLLAVVGCSATVKTIAYDPQEDDAYLGTVTMSFIDGTGSVSVQAVKSGRKATGVALYKYGMGSNRGGGIRLQIDDGRIAEGEWMTTGMTSGIGSARDQQGNVWMFVFGGSDAEREAFLAKQRANRAAQAKPVAQEQRSAAVSGTGFFISSKGHVLTNHHVIQGRSSIFIVTVDGKKSPAVVHSVQQDDDLAVLKVDTESPPLPFGSEKLPARGDEVLTLGYPLLQIQGQDQKASFGRINSLSGVQGDSRYIQIDVPVQPGNSGGPLLNSSGEVIGVVSSGLNQIAVLKASGVIPQNVTYAVKADRAEALCRGLDGLGHLPHGGGSKPMPEVIKSAEKSVVLILAE